MGRASQQGRESRLRILDATLHLASERGYDGTTIGLVSEETGLPASSIYWHFENKEALLAAAMEHGISQLPLEPPEQRGTPYDELVHVRFARAVEMVTSRPEVWQFGLMLTLERRPKEPAARKAFVTLRRRLTDTLAEWWQATLPEEVADPELARKLAVFHLAAIDGFFVGHSADQGWDLERLGRLIAAGVVAQVEKWREGSR
ncbi:MAG TPA: TetR/AcrR family transcriptional regulator [Marmoricola sp.]|nr:TetR/AcrR family transcriptional regulator [Marmoricola sp.]